MIHLLKNYIKGTFHLMVFFIVDKREAHFSDLFRDEQAEPHTCSPVGSVADLRIGGCWFDHRIGQYPFRGLMIVIATGFIPISPLSVVSTMVK